MGYTDCRDCTDLQLRMDCTDWLLRMGCKDCRLRPFLPHMGYKGCTQRPSWQRMDCRDYKQTLLLHTDCRLPLLHMGYMDCRRRPFWRHKDCTDYKPPLLRKGCRLLLLHMDCTGYRLKPFSPHMDCRQLHWLTAEQSILLQRLRRPQHTGCKDYTGCKDLPLRMGCMDCKDYMLKPWLRTDCMGYRQMRLLRKGCRQLLPHMGYTGCRLIPSLPRKDCRGYKLPRRDCRSHGKRRPGTSSLPAPVFFARSDFPHRMIELVSLP